MLPEDIHIEKLIFQEIAVGSESAFRDIFDRYHSVIYTFVFNFTHSKADAEEIVQDTFLSLWYKKEKLALVDHPRNYLYTIARHKTYDYLAKIAKNEKLVVAHWQNMQIGTNSTEEQLSAKESSVFINKAISMLSEQKQVVFRMSRIEGKNHEEIAAITGLSKSRVKNIIVEVLKHVRLYLNRHFLVLICLLMAK